MPCLREEIERLDLAQGVSPGVELLQISDLGGGIAGDVDYPVRGVSEELLQKLRATALARRINHNRGFCSREWDLPEDVFGGSGQDSDIVELVVVCILAGPVGRRLGDLHSGHRLEVPGKGEGEEAGTTVGVHQKAAVDRGFHRHVVDKGGQNKGVVLKEIACQEANADLTHPFFHYFARIGMNAAGGCTEEQGRPFPELPQGGSLVNAGTLDWQGLVEFRHCDGTAWDVDDLVT